jgi:hypothetical protein
MRRFLPVLACCLARAVAAQVDPSAQSNQPPEYVPHHIHLRSDGRCMTAQPGDVVHYTLTVENLDATQAVYGDLRLRPGRVHEWLHEDLPLPSQRSLGGGGAGQRDTNDAKLYHFAFAVPQQIVAGTYRGAGVEVRFAPASQGSAGQPQTARSPTAFPYAPGVPVTRRTGAEVRAYCLNVMSAFGTSPARPTVTNFEAGAIEPPPPAPAPAKPAPLPQEPAPIPLRPVPQPR